MAEVRQLPAVTPIPQSPQSLCHLTPQLGGLWAWPGPAFGFFIYGIRPSLWHGYLLKAGPMSHADKCHPQLLANSVELTLRFLCQGTGGFIKHWWEVACGGKRSQTAPALSVTLPPHSPPGCGGLTRESGQERDHTCEHGSDRSAACR